jgi:hypothetical protein
MGMGWRVGDSGLVVGLECVQKMQVDGWIWRARAVVVAPDYCK